MKMSQAIGLLINCISCFYENVAGYTYLLYLLFLKNVAGYT